MVKGAVTLAASRSARRGALPSAGREARLAIRATRRGSAWTGLATTSKSSSKPAREKLSSSTTRRSAAGRRAASRKTASPSRPASFASTIRSPPTPASAAQSGSTPGGSRQQLGSAPQAARRWESASRVARLPSITRTRRPLRLASWVTGASGVKFTVNSKTVPARSCPVTRRIPPPMSCTSWREMARPKPVPPYLRVVELSSWLKGVNSACKRSEGMPMPESLTSKRSNPSGEPSRGARTRRTTSPRSVNFTALPTRLTSTCFRRSGSPSTRAGTRGSTTSTSSMPFSSARRASRSSASSINCRRSKLVVASSTRPASILEKSRMSSMSWSREAPLARTTSA